MTSFVFIAVLFAAVLHAVWNAMVKGGNDKFANMAAVMLGHVPPALILLPFVPSPTVESYPYILAGIALHLGYQYFLLYAYRIGDLTHVYPIARGAAPLIVTVVSIAFLGVDILPLEILAVLLIAVGIFSISLVRQRDGQRNTTATLMALGTGMFIASYSLVDGHGARVAQTALGYYCWLTFGNAFLFALSLYFIKPSALTQLHTTHRKTFIIGGTASFAAYAIVTWCFTQAPIALVTALRETSIIIALLIGVFVLKEKLSLAKVFSTAITLTGAALLRLARQF